MRSRLWAIVVPLLLLLPAPALADHLQGHLAKAGEVLKGNEEVFEGTGLKALYDRLVEADAMEQKIDSMDRTITTLEAQLKEYRERAQLTEVQRADYEKLRETYELHLQIYRDAIKQYKDLLVEARAQAAEALKMIAELHKANQSLQKELFWTRLLGPLYMIVGLLGMGALGL